MQKPARDFLAGFAPAFAVHGDQQQCKIYKRYSKVASGMTSPSAPLSVSAVLRDTRMSVCKAHVSGGPDASLAAVASGSIRLYRYVADGELLWAAAFKTLLQVAVNLKLPVAFGRRVVQAAIYAGPNFYSDISEAA